jgi:integrase
MPKKKAKRARGMGQVIKKGGVWGIRWREAGQRRYKGGFPDDGTALRVLQQLLRDVAEGRAPGAPDPKNLPTLNELEEKWIERRRHTHRSWRDDKNRWSKHVGPYFGHCKPPEVDAAMIRRFTEQKIAEGLSSASVRNCVRLLSTFFTDIVEQGYARANPAVSLPRATKRLLRPSHDPRETPFIERQEDVRRVFLALEQPFATVFAIGALAGLRPGEVLALEWGDFDLGMGRLLVQRQVRNGRVGPPKSGKPRLVPLIEPLVKILAEHKLATGGAGKLFPPLNEKRGGTPGRPAQYLSIHLVWRKLRAALKACGLPETMTLYHCTRHTYGAQHVMGGGSLATLREILGHSSVQVTERYGHLNPDHFRREDLLKMRVDFARPGGEVIELPPRRVPLGHSSGTESDEVPEEPAASVQNQ